MKNLVKDIIFEHNLVIEKLVLLEDQIEEICKGVCTVVQSGKKVLLCGNGGSAADAQHIAAEFTGRFVKERRALAAIALTTDTSALTAIGNDYGFDMIFKRQVEALAQPGDMVIGISTSGNSINVLNALDAAKKMGCLTVGLTGKSGGNFITSCDMFINVPSYTTARIQEAHILIGHIICDYLDNNI